MDSARRHRSHACLFRGTGFPVSAQDTGVVGRVWSRRSALLIRSSLLVTECSFAEGMACVDMAGNRRYIDQVRETIVIQPQFGAGSHGFSKGLAGVQIDKKMGF